MQKLVENYGCDDLIDDLRSVQVTCNKAVDEAIQTWLSAVQKTVSRLRIEGIMGAIFIEEFQGGGLSSLGEKKTSLSTGLHYTLWNALAKQDDFAPWLSKMMSLPFMYGFAI